MLLLCCGGCVNDLKQVEALHERSVGVEVAKNIKTYYYGQTGQLKGLLTAPLLYRYMKDTPYMVMDHGLRVDFYNDSMQVQSVLTAKKGEYFENSANIVVRDSVVVTTIQSGKKLETSELHWDPDKQQFYTNKPATLTLPTRTVFAQNGLVAPPDISWYRLFQVSGNLKMDSGYLSRGATGDSMRQDSTARVDSISPLMPGKNFRDTTTQRPGT